VRIAEWFPQHGIFTIETGSVECLDCGAWGNFEVDEWLPAE
jgi:hypothetical protein